MSDVQRSHPEYFSGKNWYPQEDYDALVSQLAEAKVAYDKLLQTVDLRDHQLADAQRQFANPIGDGLGTLPEGIYVLADAYDALARELEASKMLGDKGVKMRDVQRFFLKCSHDGDNDFLVTESPSGAYVYADAYDALAHEAEALLGKIAVKALEIMALKGSYDCEVDKHVRAEYERAYGFINELAALAKERL